MSLRNNNLRRLRDLFRDNSLPWFERYSLDELQLATRVFEDILDSLREHRAAQWEREIGIPELGSQRCLPFKDEVATLSEPWLSPKCRPRH